jgi:hypothetical protein
MCETTFVVFDNTPVAQLVKSFICETKIFFLNKQEGVLGTV